MPGTYQSAQEVVDPLLHKRDVLTEATARRR
jgi:hypothetical protein